MTAKAKGESPVLRDPSCVETLSRDRFKGLHSRTLFYPS